MQDQLLMFKLYKLKFVIPINPLFWHYSYCPITVPSTLVAKRGVMLRVEHDCAFGVEAGYYASHDCIQL